MFSATEVLTAIVYVIGLLMVRLALWGPTVMPYRHIFLAAYCAALLAKICTVLEGVVLAGLLNALEHLLIAVAAVLFCVAVGLLIGPADSDGEPKRRRT